jgi:hypothetical protein
MASVLGYVINNTITVFYLYMRSLFYTLQTYMGSWDTAVGIATGYRLDDQGVKFESQYGQELSSTLSRPTLGPTQLLILCVSGVLSPVVKQPRREADHSPPTRAEVKKTWIYISTRPICFHGIVFS